MKKNILKGFALSAVLAVVLSLATGCEDKLNALPGEKKVYGDIIVDEPTAQIALNGVYYRFSNAGSSADEAITTLWATTNEIIPGSASGLGKYPYGAGFLEDNSTMTSSNYLASYAWSYCYTLINAANGVIEQTEAVDDSKFPGNRKAEILAESRWMRAYGHFMLLCWYGQFWDTSSDKGVIIRDEFVTVNNLSLPRSSVAATYEIILDDIEYAITNAPAGNPNHYVNPWVGKALKARVLMMRGGSQDYTDVISITNDIITNGPYELEANLKDIFYTKGLSSNEVMLGVYPYDNQAGHRKSYLDTYNRPGIVTTTKMDALFADDPRGTWVVGDVPVTTMNYVINPDGSYYVEYGSAWSIGKYMGEKGEVAYCLRLTEMYLLHAEAVLRSGGSVAAAKERIREVKEKAGVTDFTALDAITDRDALLRALWDEWALNMSYENGQEWFALLRFPLSVILEIKPEVVNENYKILPIPYDEFAKNPAIKGSQNPGYTE